MKQLTIGIFHDDLLAKELGKKATESDMVLHHRKMDDTIFSFIHPVDDKLSVKTQILSIIDVAIVSAETITHSFGETVLLIDAMNITKGCIIVPPYSDTAQVKEMIKDTSLQQFHIIEKDIHLIMKTLQDISVDRDKEQPVMITIDHSFPVKGIGEVILGFIQKGKVHTHDKLLLLPANNQVIVRSIQMQDKDVKEAEAGSRVGLAVKGADINDLSRGCIICAPETVSIGKEFTVDFLKNNFYPDVITGKFHVSVGMQTSPIEITDSSEKSISFQAEKPLCFTNESMFLFLNLNASKLHFMGSGTTVKKYN